MYRLAIEHYIGLLLETDAVQQFLEEQQVSIQKPIVCVVPSCGPQWAGLTYSHSLIEISSWITVDEDATLSVARHELAHVIANGCELPGTSHGQNYIKVLKCVSEKLWRKDKHWYPNARIEKARLILHPKAKSLLR